MKTRLVMAVVTTLFSVIAFARTYYVDAANFGKPGMTGESEALAFGTIQEGVAQAASGDTVLVAEGVYDQGGERDASGYLNRVYVTNTYVMVRAVGRMECTHIVGAWDPVSTYASGGVGPNAVRCVQFSSGGHNSVLQGFTIRDSACHTQEDRFTGYGGGVLGGGSNCKFYIVDCVISNCVGVRGGATKWATCVRSRITGNLGGASAGRDSKFLHCDIVGNLSSSELFMNCTCVGCTISANPGVAFGASSTKYTVHNCVVAGNGSIAGDTCKFQSRGSVFAPSASGNKVLTNSGSDFSGSVTNAAHLQFFAPLLDNWRLLPDSPAIGLADSSLIATIPMPSAVQYTNVTVNPYLDIDGIALAKTGRINAGARQAVSPAPASGALLFASPVEVDGHLVSGTNLYVHSATYPAQYRIKAPAVAGRSRVFWYDRSAVDGGCVYPQPDDSVWMLLPPPGVVVTNTPLVTTNLFYVGPDGDDAADGRSIATAKRTLQGAADAAPRYSVILASEGVYDEGGAVRNGVSNRVYITKEQRFVGAGAGRSVIRGAADPDNPTGIPGDGRGTNACRCVCMSKPAAVQGFTLTDGFCGYDPSQPTLDDARTGFTYGGAFSTASTGTTRPLTHYILDCVITNSYAPRGGAAYCGTLIRCEIADCWSDNGILRYARLVSCLIRDHYAKNGNGNAGTGNGSAIHCTWVGRKGDTYGKIVATSGSNDVMTNCVVIAGDAKFAATAGHPFCTLIDGVAYNAASTTAVTNCGGVFADAQLYRAEAGDCRPLSSSAAVGLGRITDGSYRVFSSGLNCEPILFVDGCPTAGAVQTTVQSVIVVPPDCGSVSVTTVTNAVPPGETIEFGYSDMRRPCFGFIANGREVLSESLRYSFTAGPETTSVGGLVVEPLIRPHWYVDAMHGDDAGTGFSTAYAKRTLAGMMAIGDAIRPGDTVHVAEGVYDEGAVSYGKSAKIGTRVVVPNGVVLLADGDRAKTIIRGAADPNGDSLGLGDAAVRCVALSDEFSVVKGFTLAGGRTSVSGTSEGVNYSGAGVYTTASVASPLAAQVVDCVITDCVASVGGGGYNRIDYVNCRFVGNRALNGRSAVTIGAAYNCVFTGNRGVNCAQNMYDIVNCTFFDNYKNATDETDGTIAYDIAVIYTGAAVYNTIAKGPVKGSNTHYFYASNCLFNATYNTSTYKQKNNYDAKTRVLDESVFVFNADGSLPTTDHPAIDMSDPSLEIDIRARFPRMDFETCLDGGQRIYNRVMDLGCFEFDYRPKFAAALGAGVTVTNASPGVSLEDGKVRLADGVTISGEWASLNGNRMARYSCTAFASGEGGTLAGAVGEHEIEVSAGTQDLKFRARNTAFDIGFTYIGAGYGELSGFSQIAPGTLLFLR